MLPALLYLSLFSLSQSLGLQYSHLPSLAGKLSISFSNTTTHNGKLQTGNKPHIVFTPLFLPSLSLATLEIPGPYILAFLGVHLTPPSSRVP